MPRSLSQLRHEYSRCATAASELDQREAALERSRAEVDALRAEVSRARKVADVEQAEADEWASDGFHRTLSRLLGRLEERREKELQEAVAAAAQYALAQERLEAALARREDARDAVREAREARSALGALKRELDQRVGEDTELSKELSAISDRREILEAQRAVLQPLLRACGKAVDDVKQALERIVIARRLAGIDVATSGPGVWPGQSNLWKTQEITAAVAYTSRMNVSVSTLRELLGNLDLPEVEIPVGLRNENGLLTWDRLLDGIFLDGIVFQRIAELKGSLEEISHPLEELQRSLLARHQDLQAGIDELEALERRTVSGS